MSGTYTGGKRAAETNKKKYGDDFYANIGRMGGTAKTIKPKGFAANPELARLAGAVGGRKSKRGIKMSDELFILKRQAYQFASRVRFYERKLTSDDLITDYEIQSAESNLERWKNKLEQVTKKIKEIENA